MNVRNFYSILPFVNLLKGAKSSSVETTAKSVGNAASHYKRSTPPISLPLNKLLSPNFPLSLQESIQDYKVRNNLLDHQKNLLSTLPFYPTKDSLGRSSDVIQTYIDDMNYINEFVIFPNDEAKLDYTNKYHLIMIHGYGSGLGLYLKNYNDITLKNWVIHSIDLLGYGCSSRPEFTPNNFDEVEKWFHDSFETWFNKRNIPKERTLVMAHSMGAYLMASYGIKKDPNFCKELIMCSPGAIIEHKLKVTIPKYFEKLWERNISPFSLVRTAKVYGSKLVSGWTYRRFAKLQDRERSLLHKYIYGIFQARGSGEYMLNYLLKPGANPRVPMIARDIEKNNCKFRWWYGSEDWMNPQGGKVCSQKLQANGKESKVMEISNAGHHVYLDNYQQFNKMLINEMNDLEKV